jgi:hypothetical protein
MEPSDGKKDDEPVAGKPNKLRLLRTSTGEVIKRVGVRRDTGEVEYQTGNLDDVARFVEQDPLVRATRAKVDTLSLLWGIREQVAREASSLEFQRNEQVKQGFDTSKVSTRRVDALKKLADIEMAIQKNGGGGVNLQDERIQRVFKFWVECIREVVVSVLNPEQADLFFSRLQTAMEGWEQKAADLVR